MFQFFPPVSLVKVEGAVNCVCCQTTSVRRDEGTVI